jgi:hypothetical protein
MFPYEPIVELAPNLWCVQGSIPGVPLKRRMTLARLADGRIVIHNAIELKKKDMKRIEAWGTPAFIVVPNGYHRLDAPKLKQRYPDAEVVCPRGSRARVEQVVPVDLGYDEFPDDEQVSMEHLEGTDEREGVLSVKSDDGTTRVFNDVLFNIPRLDGFAGFVLKTIGTTGGPRVTPVAKLLVLREKRALAAHLDRLATPDVVRLVPGHGELVDTHADETLYRVAVGL